MHFNKGTATILLKNAYNIGVLHTFSMQRRFIFLETFQNFWQTIWLNLISATFNMEWSWSRTEVKAVQEWI